MEVNYVSRTSRPVVNNMYQDAISFILVKEIKTE